MIKSILYSPLNYDHVYNWIKSRYATFSHLLQLMMFISKQTHFIHLEKYFFLGFMKVIYLSTWEKKSVCLSCMLFFYLYESVLELEEDMSDCDVSKAFCKVFLDKYDINVIFMVEL